MDWLKEAKCKKMDTSVFFPRTSEDSMLAKSICADCSVKQECLKYAIDNDISYGVWGGLSESTRRTIRTQRKTINEPV
jgi:WhiB family redox-sensing transcriptional regulator